MGLIKVQGPVLGPDGASQGDALVYNGSLWVPSNPSRKNLIINGGFDIWQRGTSVSSSSWSWVYCADRWRFYANLDNVLGSATVSRQSFTPGQTDVPGEPAYYLRWNQTVAVDEQSCGLVHPIEGVRTAAGQTATLSFYGKANSPRTIQVRLRQFFGTGGSTLVEVASQNISLTTSWQKFSVVFDVPSITGKTIGSDSDHLDIEFIDSNLSTFTIELACVQFEIGSVASPFEYRTFAEELAMCMRYYEKSFPYGVEPTQNTGESLGVFTIPIWTATANQNMGTAYYKAVKRTTLPTVTTYNPFAVGSGWSRSGSGDYAVAVNAYGEHSLGLRCGGTPAVGGALQIHWTASAEL